MAKTSLTEFCPDWVSAPGDTIADILAERELTVAELAGAIDKTVEQAQGLVQGKVRISNKIAERLAKNFGTSVEFWLARESQYREDLHRLQRRSVAHTKAAWLKELPLGDMIKFGWLPPVNSISEKIDECLRFFDVPDETVWRQKYSDRIQGPAYRTSPAFKQDVGAVSAWLRRGEIESALIHCKPWDAALFKNNPSFRYCLASWILDSYKWRLPTQCLYVPSLTERLRARISWSIVKAKKSCSIPKNASFDRMLVSMSNLPLRIINCSVQVHGISWRLGTSCEISAASNI